MTQGKTPFWHQVRDQALHWTAGAAIAGLWLALYLYMGGHTASPWLLTGIAVALLWTFVREFLQWQHLNSPSLLDSMVDSTFVVFGAISITAAWVML